MPLYMNGADSHLVAHFGHGDMIVSTSTDLTEVILTPMAACGVIGRDSEALHGKSTSEIAPGIRLVFDHPGSALVVIDALSKVAQHLMGMEVKNDGD
jgi:hypothetical protein